MMYDFFSWRKQAGINATISLCLRWKYSFSNCFLMITYCRIRYTSFKRILNWLFVTTAELLRLTGNSRWYWNTWCVLIYLLLSITIYQRAAIVQSVCIYPRVLRSIILSVKFSVSISAQKFLLIDRSADICVTKGMKLKRRFVLFTNTYPIVYLYISYVYFIIVRRWMVKYF